MSQEDGNQVFGRFKLDQAIAETTIIRAINKLHGLTDTTPSFRHRSLTPDDKISSTRLLYRNHFRDMDQDSRDTFSPTPSLTRSPTPETYKQSEGQNVIRGGKRKYHNEQSDFIPRKKFCASKPSLPKTSSITSRGVDRKLRRAGVQKNKSGRWCVTPGKHLDPRRRSGTSSSLAKKRTTRSNTADKQRFWQLDEWGRCVKYRPDG